jgi:hypothetical protein
VVFVTKKGSRLETAQACALGATDLVHRVIDVESALIKPWSNLKSLAESHSAFRNKATPSIEAGLDALQNVLATAAIGSRLDVTVIDGAGDATAEQIGCEGLASWIDTVRKHHSQTYQHSLLVTGLAVGFGTGRRVGA